MLTLSVHQGVTALKPQRRRARADRYCCRSVLPYQVAVVEDQCSSGGGLGSCGDVHHHSSVDQSGGTVHQHEPAPCGQGDYLAVGPIPALKRFAVQPLPSPGVPALDRIQLVLGIVIGLLQGFIPRLLARLNRLRIEGILQIVQGNQTVSGSSGIGPRCQH